MMSYIAAVYLLKENGLANDSFTTDFAINPPNAVMAAFYRQTDAAGAGAQAVHLPIVSSKIDITQLKYLAKGEPLTHLPWAFKGTLPDTLKSQIKRTFLDLNSSNKGKNILTQIGLSGIHQSDNNDFNRHRVIIKEVLGEEY